MMNKYILTIIISVFTFCVNAQETNSWLIESQKDWEVASGDVKNINLVDGELKSLTPKSQFTSKIKRFKKKRSAESIVFKQTDAWANWTAIPDIGPENIGGAQIFISPKEGEYYLIGGNKDYNPIKKYDANGKKYWEQTEASKNNKSLRGYHVWYSKNMLDWKHCGLVSDPEASKMTTAEYVDGKFYIYYDYPNDEDPHLIIDENLQDGKMGKKYGMVLNDPSHGSDAGILRDEDGTFHLIFENWDYNDPTTHSFDSPVAGYATSPDGIEPFTIHDYFPIDERTTPTGEIGVYYHKGKTKRTYQRYAPEQNAYGDWTAIKVGGQYYLFCDYDEAGGRIKIGWFTSDSWKNKFEFVGEIGDGHPDPTIGFAKGKFYLIQQQGDVDYISSGPWVEGVEARVGVDTNNDGKVNEWTDWKEIKETYSRKPDFTRIIDKTPAILNLKSLPKGYGFVFEYRTDTSNELDVKVAMKKVELTFK